MRLMQIDPSLRERVAVERAAAFARAAQAPARFWTLVARLARRAVVEASTPVGRRAG